MAYLRGYGDIGTDLLGGLTSGAGAGAVLSYNSTKYPGTCKPSNTYTLNLFKALQSQLNRVAQLQGLSKISTDGDIGPGTVSLASRAIGAPSSCTAIAANVAGYTQQAKIMADTGGAPSSVSAPPQTKPSTIVDAITGMESPAPSGIAASLTGLWDGLTPAGKIGAVGILGGIGYYLYKKAK